LLDLQRFFVPNQAEDDALLSQGKEDNAVRRKKDRKGSMRFVGG
jgi:hypothetical protein